MNISPYRLAVDLRVSPLRLTTLFARSVASPRRWRFAWPSISGTPSSSGSICRTPFAVYHARKKYSKELKGIKTLAGAVAR